MGLAQIKLEGSTWPALLTGRAALAKLPQSMSRAVEQAVSRDTTALGRRSPRRRGTNGQRMLGC